MEKWVFTLPPPYEAPPSVRFWEGMFPFTIFCFTSGRMSFLRTMSYSKGLAIDMSSSIFFLSSISLMRRSLFSFLYSRFLARSSNRVSFCSSRTLVSSITSSALCLKSHSNLCFSSCLNLSSCNLSIHSYLSSSKPRIRSL